MNLSQDELLSQLRQMDEYEFEELVADVWKQRGWETTVTTGSSDRGIDVIAEKSTPFSQKHLIQAKRYSAGNKIGSPDVQQYSSLRQQEDDVDAVVVVTTSSFTTQSEQTAKDLNVKLIDGKKLCEMVSNLDSREFISEYINIEGKRKQNTNKQGREQTHNNKREPLGWEECYTTEELLDVLDDSPRELPDDFVRSHYTRKFGSRCPICGAYEKICKWEDKSEDDEADSQLICDKCATQWIQVETNRMFGLLSGGTEWKIVGEGTQKEASEWKAMKPGQGM